MISLVDPGRLGPGIHMVDQFKNCANTAVFAQGLTSHQTGDGWWQYAAFYDPDRLVRVARRDPDGVWDTITLPITLPQNDSHFTLAVGTSPVDGRLHVCSGGHASPMIYTRTYAGYLDEPLDVAWDAAIFEAPGPTLAGVEVGNVTYPTFTTKPNGELLFWYRNGGSSNGRLRLAEATEAGWTLLGDVTSSTGTWTAWNGGQSTTRNFYWAPPRYGGTRLHMVGTWRESNPAVMCAPASPIANHHVVYVYSDDHGRTWHTNGGIQVAATGVDPIDVNTPGIHVDTGTDTRYGLQVASLATGPDGLVGYLANYVRGSLAGGCVNNEAERVKYAGEHMRWRDPATGGWTNSSVMVGAANVFCEYPAGRAGRGHLVFGPDGTAHVFYSGLRVYSAEPPYTTWALTVDGPRYLNAFGEAHQPDRSRESEGLVAFLYCEHGGGTSSQCVREFDL